MTGVPISLIPERGPKMNPLVEEKWKRLQAEIEGTVSQFNKVTCRILGWKSVSLDEGMQWVQSAVYEGFYIGYRVQLQGSGAAELWLKAWEFGEEEPPWDVEG